MSLKAADLVAGAVTISSPPLIYQRLVEVINHPRSGPSDIAAVISEDQGLTVRLLRVVNSAFFSFPQRIETVTQAVTVVGTVQVRDLALATSVMTLFDDVPPELVSMESFWKHSLATGVAARVIAGIRQENNVERFFVAGLLHDVGRLIMCMRAGELVKDAMELVESTGGLLYTAEKDVFGFHHAKVGGLLMDQWNMPASYREGVAYHHNSRRASRFPVETAAVHVADIISNGMQWGSSGERRVPDVDAHAWDALDIDPTKLPMIFDDIEHQFGAVAQLTQGLLAA